VRESGVGSRESEIAPFLVVLQTGFRAGNALVPPKRSVDLEERYLGIDLAEIWIVERTNFKTHQARALRLVGAVARPSRTRNAAEYLPAARKGRGQRTSTP